jgi:hypothetical protein
MSEQAPERTTQRKPAGGQKKILGLPRNVAIAALAGVAALAFLWWRSRSSSSGTSTAGQACTDANGNPGTFDSSGNCVTSTEQASQTDLSGEPCTDADGNPGLTDALGNCLASQQLSTATGTTGTTTATGTGTTTTTGTTTSTGTGGGGTTTPAPATVKVPNVVGMWVARAGGAEDAITRAGLTYRTVPTVNPKNTYKVSSQSPKAGSSVKRGSRVTLNIHIVKRG